MTRVRPWLDCLTRDMSRDELRRLHDEENAGFSSDRSDKALFMAMRGRGDAPGDIEGDGLERVSSRPRVRNGRS